MTAQLVTDALVMAIWRRGKPPRVPDAAKPDVEIIVADHGVDEVRAVVKFQGVARIGRLWCALAPRARCLMCLRSSAARPAAACGFYLAVLIGRGDFGIATMFASPLCYDKAL
jgi:hypothetical protein